MRKNTHSDRSTATFNTVITIFFAVLLAQTAAVYILSGNIVCLFVSAGVMLLCAGIVYFCKNRLSSYFFSFYSGTVEKLKTPDSDLFTNFTMPVLLLKGNKIVWYNKRFRTDVLKGKDVLGDLPDEIFPETVRSAISVSDRADVSFGGRKYTVYKTCYEAGGEKFDTLYFVDVTDLKRIADEFDASRPVVMIMSIDSFDELTVNLAESERAASGFGLDALKEAVEQLLGRGKHHVKLLLPYAVGGMVAALHDTAQVLSSSYTENGIELDAIVDETLFGRLRQYVTEEV